MGRFTDLPASYRRRGVEGACAVAAVLDQLDPPDRADLADALARTGDDGRTRVATYAIVGALVDHGYPLTQWTVAKHRKGRCGCARKGDA